MKIPGKSFLPLPAFLLKFLGFDFVIFLKLGLMLIHPKET